MLRNEIVNTYVKFAIAGFIVISVFILGGCSSDVASRSYTSRVEQRSAPQPIIITGVNVDEDSESAFLSITSNKLLTYSPAKPTAGLLNLYFPDTGLSMSKTEIEPVNSVISSIKAIELVEGGPSKISITLKDDVPYEINREGTGLKISFSKASIKETEDISKESVVTDSDITPVDKNFPEGTTLNSVEFAELENSINISIISDGSIKDYSVFTLQSRDDLPARIVFDIKNIKSKFKKEQVVPVNSKWVKRIRHFAYPDYLRFVLDTKDSYLNDYSAIPVENGIMIRFGLEEAETSLAIVSENEEQIKENDFIEEDTAVQESPSPTTTTESIDTDTLATDEIVKEKSVDLAESGKSEIDYSKQAIVNSINFTSGDEGKSTVAIGITNPVKYDVTKTGQTELQITLYNTKIPGYRLRPLVTRKFNSAVDLITPLYAKATGNDSIVKINLREAVPYLVTQTDDQINIDLEASSIISSTEPVDMLGDQEVALNEDISVKDTSTESVYDEPYDSSMEDMASDIVEEDVAMDEVGYSEGEDKENTEMEGGKRYTGEKITMNFYETDIKNVFRILKAVSKKNFVIDKDVKGRFSGNLENVPWDQVMDLALKMNKLSSTVEGNVIRIVTQNTKTAEEKIKNDEELAKKQFGEKLTELEPLVTEYIPISYSNASSDIKPHLQSLLTPDRGTISVDARTNQIIITDVAEKVEQAKDLVQRLDKVTPQVVIEARIVEVSESFSRELGTEWGVGTRDASGNLSPIVGQQGVATWEVAMNHPAASTGSLAYNFSRIVGTPFSLNAKLHAAEVQGDGKIISSPKIVTLDNKQAKISQGLEYPYQKSDGDGNTVTEFKSIKLELTVTPHVTPDNRISMQINISKNDVEALIGGVPSLATNSANTELLVNNGDTIVIGGIIKTTTASGENAFPGLSKIPVLGWLFKSKSFSTKKNELLIFITPNIVQLEKSGL
ncbi:MAG: type IV pilus secretin PilQ [Desulfobacterales bacterium]|jgi:type IV pilus assembly protein PilQ|nr:type IV pilus secretin PilQ [Desulfobacteraceae bacterium]MBT4365710.1 type IV pilus secretin PilQ [Desulfobacteraceae bacterium]MBT7086777.1 type IV pilus secretin PilQ [Desulfobacterales bacterium]MBT7696094.1 type IV pilus secretin PilQ [Desulfobacterales bacterium]